MVSADDIIRTIEAGDVERAKLLLLQYPCDSNEAGHWNQFAALCDENDQPDILNFMLDRGLDICKMGYNLMFDAICFGNERMARFLFDKGPAIMDSKGKDLLHLACDKGLVELAEFMLKSLSDVSSRFTIGPDTCIIGVKTEHLTSLQVAARNAHFLDTSNYVHLAKLLLAHGADIRELEEVDYGGTLKRRLKELEEQEMVRIYFRFLKYQVVTSLNFQFNLTLCFSRT
ncbi:hypothetical protein BKA69DRAFT_74110 [Paraphysoderma sedebokerense]|nr:hypothetical protein BKA69DRAFT_74110 [Paraphysoderma sedebokerense]